MKIADLSRHRRVLLLCAGSAVVHLVVLAWFAARGADPVAAPVSAALSLRLLPAGAAAVLPVSVPPVTAMNATTAAPTPKKASAATATPSSPPPSPLAGGSSARAVSSETAGAGTDINTDAATASTAAPDASAEAAQAGAPLMQMPGRYRVRLPAPALLTYAVARSVPNGAPTAAGVAHLDWRTDGERYLLAIDGPLGTLRSEGTGGDAGIVPRSARETRDGADLTTEFAPERHLVLFHASGAEAPDNIGIQDRASLLLQLAGIGLGNPDQVRDAVDIVVAGTHDARIAHFQVIGSEAVGSGAGVIQAWHLAEAAAAGMPRLDVWLAPARGWLPVQLRVTDADGAAFTQTLTSMAPGADLAAPAAPQR